MKIREAKIDDLKGIQKLHQNLLAMNEINMFHL